MPQIAACQAGEFYSHRPRRWGTSPGVRYVLCDAAYSMLRNCASGPEIGLFRVGLRPDPLRESVKLDLRPAGGPILRLSRAESGRNPARKFDFRPGSIGAMDVTKPYELIGFGDIHGSQPYNFVGLGAEIRSRKRPPQSGRSCYKAFEPPRLGNDKRFRE